MGNDAGHLQSYRWQPGCKSPNPGGRPRRRPLSNRLEFLSELPIPREIRYKTDSKGVEHDLMPGLPEDATLGDAATYAIYMRAVAGDTPAFREIRVAVEGRSGQRIESIRDVGDRGPLTPLQEKVAKLSPVDRNLLVAARNKIADMLRAELDKSQARALEPSTGTANPTGEIGAETPSGSDEPSGETT